MRNLNKLQRSYGLGYGKVVRNGLRPFFGQFECDYSYAIVEMNNVYSGIDEWIVDRILLMLQHNVPEINKQC